MRLIYSYTLTNTKVNGSFIGYIYSKKIHFDFYTFFLVWALEITLYSLFNEDL